MATEMTEVEREVAGIASSVIPYPRDDNKAKYLGLRATGFSVREALAWLKLAKSTLSFWRLNPEFCKLEESVPSFRKTLGMEYAGLEFLRNFRMVLEKDREVLDKSLKGSRVVGTKDGKPIYAAAPLTAEEHEYFLKMRSFYPPQQLAAMETVLSGASDGSREYDFT